MTTDRPVLHIALLVPGLPFDKETLKTQSLGGSETAGLSIARALRDRGHRVYLFCNTQTQYDDNRIDFIPYQMFQRFMTFMPHDVCIIQRMPQMMRSRGQGKLNILWQHDMTLLRHHEEFVAAMWNTDRVALLSDYMIEQYRDVHGDKILPDSNIFKTRNGIDLELFPNYQNGKLHMPSVKKRDRKLLIYSARPERGLDHLLKNIMPDLIKEDPEIKLGICGYNNEATELEGFYNWCNQMAADLQPNVVNFGALSKPKLYELYSRAGAYVYPTPSPSNPKFREISCISVMECMAAGLPVVASAQGALTETLNKKAGFLIEGIPGEEAHDSAFKAAILDLMHDNDLYKKCSGTGTHTANGLSWKSLAEEWEAFFIHEIEKKSANESTMVAHFGKTGDKLAAQLLIGNDEEEIKVKIPGYATPEQSAVVKQWIEKMEAKTVLDYGQLTELRKLMPDVEFSSEPGDQKFDMVALVNRLEYERHPEHTLEEEETHLRDGGNMLICTPTGPFKTDRLWNFEAADIEDLIAHKEKFDLFANMSGANAHTGDPIGYIFSKYKYRPDKGIGVINMDRKFKIQGPKETLSVNIIAGGDKVKDTLHWCLKSVEKIADEIIIVDTGMDEEARRIAHQYDAKIIKGSNPLEVGFEVPRNEALEVSSSDWILWLDCDEKLIGPEFLGKYLRANVFDGYAIKQHHFGVGISHEPDMPVRLFRRNDEIRFYGRIHEHPEKEMNKGPGLIVVLSDVHIMHVGYDSERARSDRFRRNTPLLEMDKKDYPDRILQKHMIMRDNMILVNNMMAQNGNQITEEIKQLCEETIELWRKYFKGGTELVGLDSTPYYNDACRVLGLGVDVAFAVEAGRDGYGANLNGQGQRFANEDDLMSEINLKVKRKTEQFLKDNF